MEKDSIGSIIEGIHEVAKRLPQDVLHEQYLKTVEEILVQNKLAVLFIELMNTCEAAKNFYTIGLDYEGERYNLIIHRDGGRLPTLEELKARKLSEGDQS